MRVAGVLSATLVLMLACARDDAPVRHATAQPKWMKEDKRKVQASAAVQALAAAPDPDAEVKPMSQEEVKATLAAARGADPLPSSLPPPTLGQSGEWGAMEQSKRAKDAAHAKRLDETIVFSAGGSTYHASGCSHLWVREVDRDGKERQRYIGSSMTLRKAEASHMTPDDACGAPSYEFRYSQ